LPERKRKRTTRAKAFRGTGRRAAPPRDSKGGNGAADEGKRRYRGLWSGTLTFGLVSVPVDLYPANRPRGMSLRIVDESGTPLRRVYFCAREEQPVGRDDIVRGYEVEPDRYVVVTDDELAALAPKKSREIDLRRFVDAATLDPFHFERAYYLMPARGSTKAYRLLAATMEETGKAGIATFVMHDREYLVAILAADGVLRAETLRFADELRTAHDVGLPKFGKPDTAAVRKLEREIAKLTADELDRDELADRYVARLREVVERKRAAGKDVVEAPAAERPEESAQIIDLMEVLKRSLGTETRAGPRRAGAARSRPRDARSRAARGDGDGLASATKAELYARAQRLGIEGRASMTKRALIEAIRRAS
jgi:DNA end-binding protein Ku